jgi:hypothetical protein
MLRDVTVDDDAIATDDVTMMMLPRCYYPVMMLPVDVATIAEVAIASVDLCSEDVAISDASFVMLPLIIGAVAVMLLPLMMFH